MLFLEALEFLSLVSWQQESQQSERSHLLLQLPD